LVADQRVIGKGYNQVERLKDPTAHAEMLAITAASNFLAAKYLQDCDLYVTVEPCTMCMGAIEHARVKRIFIGCKEPRHGYSKRFVPAGVEVVWGMMEEESKLLMQTFFESKRN
ncbi:nucleoside deaminase, partial [bacterium]|nr:nucleoside deaminase [bacterium]